MGYLSNSSLTVDAILTDKGRELLSLGKSEFNITQFALADDEVDYDLWNPANPLGSNFYGVIIENLPLVEASPDANQSMKYKLVTLPKKSAKIPVLAVDVSSLTLQNSQRATITPSTINFQNGNATLGYTAIISNSDVASISVSPGSEVTTGTTPTTPRFIGDQDSAQSVAVSGFKFDVVGKAITTQDQTATVTIIGNETGARVTVNVTVKKLSVNNTSTN